MALVTLLIPSVSAEAFAQYQAGHGKGLVFNDQTGPQPFFWYVPQTQVRTALQNPRIPDEVKTEIEWMVTNYLPDEQAILVILGINQIQPSLIDLADYTQVRSPGTSQLKPLPQEIKKPAKSVAKMPPGVKVKSASFPDGTTHYQFSHPDYGNLGRMLVLVAGAGQTELRAEIVDQKPGEPKGKWEARSKMFGEIVNFINKGFETNGYG